MDKKSKKVFVAAELLEKITLRKTAILATKRTCEICGADSEMLMLDSAVTVSGLSTLEILARVESTRIHCGETPNGHLVICRRSLEQDLPAHFAALREATQKLLVP